MDDKVRRGERRAAAQPDDDRAAGAKVDWEVAMDVVGGDVDLLVEVLGAFQKESREMIASIHEALDARDASVLHRAAHTIKNGCYNLGAQETGDVAFELEVMGRDATFDQVPPLLVELETQLKQIQREVEQYLREPGRG
jgi:HPt (histidine-containing phosphotransfer) domain-containing protein